MSSAPTVTRPVPRRGRSLIAAAAATILLVVAVLALQSPWSSGEASPSRSGPAAEVDGSGEGAPSRSGPAAGEDRTPSERHPNIPE